MGYTWLIFWIGFEYSPWYNLVPLVVILLHHINYYKILPLHFDNIHLTAYKYPIRQYLNNHRYYQLQVVDHLIVLYSLNQKIYILQHFHLNRMLPFIHGHLVVIYRYNMYYQNIMDIHWVISVHGLIADISCSSRDKWNIIEDRIIFTTCWYFARANIIWWGDCTWCIAITVERTWQSRF